MDEDPCRQRLRAEDCDAPPVSAFSEAESDTILAGTAPLVLVYRSGPAAVEAELAAGRTIAEGLARWKEEARRLLDLRRRARKRVMLIEDTTLLHGDAEALAPLAQLIGGPEALAPALPWPTEPRPILLLLARQAVEADPEIAALAADLEIRSLPRPDRPLPMTELEAMAQAWRDQAEARVRLEEADADRTLLKAQIAELASEVSERTRAEQRLRRQLTEAGADAEARERDRKAAEAEAAETLAAERRKLADLTGECDRLKTRIAELRATGDKSRAELEARIGALSRERDLLAGHVAELNEEATERSGAVERVLRQLAEAERAAAARSQALKAAEAAAAGQQAEQQRARTALEQERDLLMAQLSELQTENIARHAQARDLNERLSAVSADLGDKLRKAEEEIRRYEGDLGRVSGEVARLRRGSAERIATLEAKLARVTAEHGQASAGALRLSEEMEAAHRHWTGALAESQEREATLRQGLEDLTEAYDKLMRSRSWKLTEPLRAANKLLGRTRRER
ncbi:hypothetical protein JYP51_19985 [Ponticoccus gilvus]|nr:hypothetical protein [Enemella evansiae]